MQLLATLISMYFLDAVGRRPIMVFGMACQATTMFLIGGMGEITDPSKLVSANTAVVSLLVLFAASYSFGWAPANWVLVSEISEQKLRDKTTRVGTWVNFASKWVGSVSGTQSLTSTAAR